MIKKLHMTISRRRCGSFAAAAKRRKDGSPVTNPSSVGGEMLPGIPPKLDEHWTKVAALLGLPHAA